MVTTRMPWLAKSLAMGRVMPTMPPLEGVGHLAHLAVKGRHRRRVDDDTPLVV